MRTKEDSLQIAVADYLKLQYPNVLWWHTPNGGARNPIEGAKLKKMGVRAGVSDVIMIEKSKEFIGLAIELKIKPNKPTNQQLEFMIALQKKGFKCCICWNFDEAKLAIDNYLLT